MILDLDYSKLTPELQKIFIEAEKRKAFLNKKESEKFSDIREWIDAYTRFYQRQTGTTPVLTPIEFKCLKTLHLSIKSYVEFNNINSNALIMFEAILQNWKKLDTFQQNRMLIREMNTDLNKILSLLSVKNKPNETLKDFINS